MINKNTKLDNNNKNMMDDINDTHINNNIKIHSNTIRLMIIIIMLVMRL